jgi:general secretion pathway protein I
MVAMAVLAIALTVIIELFSGALRLARKSEDYSRAVFYGRQLVEELNLKTAFPNQEETGKFESAYRWKYVVESIPMVSKEQEEEFPIELYKIKVWVLWDSGNREKSLTFESLKTIAKPEEDP